MVVFRERKNYGFSEGGGGGSRIKERLDFYLFLR